MDAGLHQRESCIRQYMQGWFSQNETMLLETLSPKVHITESYGPEYAGISEVRQWFRAWHAHGQVLRWDALHFLHQGEETVVKWVFECQYDGNVDGFDGLSLIRFAPDGCILTMEEYQSKAAHHRPFADITSQ